VQAKNNSLDQVVNEIFDDRTKFISTYGWDDNAFAAPRDGSPNSQIPCQLATTLLSFPRESRERDPEAN
jgi:hypothetical protein